MRRFALHLVLSFAMGLLGCTPSEPQQPKRTPSDLQRMVQAHAQVYARTGQRFERAVFFSPDPDTTPGELRWMSPLIVEQLDPLQAAETSWPVFGRLVLDPSGDVRVDPDEPTVYQASTTVRIHGGSDSQSTFLWFYPPAGSDVAAHSAANRQPHTAVERSLAGTNAQPRWRGFRMLLDDRGFATMWAIESNDAQLRIFYVAKSVEEAARRCYGSPLAGRRYCVEPDLAEHPDVVVARIVADGPQPMGPFLYLDSPDRRVTTLICRCEPSQADLFPASRLYRLVGFEQVEPAVQRSPAWAEASARLSEPSFERLRWPAEQ